MSLKFTAVINCFNEELYIYYAIKSIYKHVDEIVIVDNNSKDNTVKIINNFKLNEDKESKIRFFPLTEQMQLADVRNFALSKSQNEWIIKWDGDFCAYDENDGISNNHAPFSDLIKIINNEYKNYDIFLLYSLNISGDLNHYDQTRKYLGLSGDSFIGKKNCMSYGVNDKYGDVGLLKNPDGSSPKFYRINNPEKDPLYFLHLYGVKNDEYLLYRRFLSEYQIWLAENRDSRLDFWNWMTEMKNYNKEGGLNYVRKQLVENMSRHGLKIPDILKEESKNPKYKILYLNGKPHDRKSFIMSDNTKK